MVLVAKQIEGSTSTHVSQRVLWYCRRAEGSGPTLHQLAFALLLRSARFARVDALFVNVHEATTTRCIVLRHEHNSVWPHPAWNRHAQLARFSSRIGVASCSMQYVQAVACAPRICVRSRVVHDTNPPHIATEIRFKNTIAGDCFAD